MNWIQNFTPIAGNLFLSALCALIPSLYFFWALAIKRMKGYAAGLSTLAIALFISVIVYKMPVLPAVMSATQGAIYGILPIGWIIIMSVFLYKLTVKTGDFGIIRNSILLLTEDSRLQALLVAFSFGAFLEGCAGFGAPVAITAALLAGLGFNPLYAAGICLLANTAPVAFGSIGIPVIAVEGATGVPAMDISQMIGRQLPLLSLFIPLYLVVIIAGFKKAAEVLPAILVCGVSFAATQFITSNFLGPELPDILSSLVSLVSLTILLKFWKPKHIFTFRSQAEKEAAPALEAEKKKYTRAQVFKAWSPYLILTIFISIWGIPQVKLALTGVYNGSNLFLNGLNTIGKVLTFALPVPWLHNKVIDSAGKPIPALYKLEVLGAAGTAILAAAIAAKFVLGVSWKNWIATFGDTMKELRLPLLTIIAVVAFAYVTNASGMATTLGMAMAKSGVLFAFFSPVLGWLGVFITGSDTSSNLLFGGLQKVTASSLDMNPVVAIAANSSGGVTGKMISPQSIAVACAAAGMAGKESELFRFTIKHSLLLLLAVCLITYIQSAFFPWIIP
ncbi:L-lactate permease [Metabacillus sp. RGM 3146]|uniref:L-lactate permease n=1 Tax=Metabacillus sp. RGM 3146 TaxID=3401092 RepID=UPI003B9A9612